MTVIPLTLAISLCLTVTFILFFIREQTRRRFRCSDSEALLPLADETPRIVGRHSAAEGLTIDFGGRLPAKRREGCGRHHHEGDHHSCEGCQHHQH